MTEDELNWIKQVLCTDFNTGNNLTENEIHWLKQVLGEDYDYDPLKLPAHYVRLKKAQYERNANKEIVRKNLDVLREKTKKFTAQELLERRNKNERESRGIEDFAGIYIIQNLINGMYYVGQSVSVFDRAYKHFLQEPTGNPEIYNDYSLGDTFSISLIAFENTSFSSLNELEDNAIRAYDSLFPNGYNRMPGNIMDKPFFNNDNYQKVADLILDKIKEAKGEAFLLTLTNARKRMVFTSDLFSELGLPRNPNFHKGFRMMLKEYKKANKKVSIIKHLY